MSARIPDAAVVDVISSAGPYREGERLVLAYHDPTVARIIAFDASARESGAHEGFVPENMLLRVARASAVYREGDEILASFTDPSFARLFLVRHPNSERASAPSGVASGLEVSPAATPSIEIGAAKRIAVADLETSWESRARSLAPTRSPALFSAWTSERIRSCVGVIDKLFTVERLGWYRHAFATRMLVAEDVAGDASVAAGIKARFAEFRSAVLDALGAPLLEAYLPGFTITPAWLDQLDDPRCAAALRALRADPSFGDILESEDSHVLEQSGSLHAWIPAFIDVDAGDAVVRHALSAYRAAAIEAFARVASAPEAVRLGTMTEPNLLLDDRLWQLVGALHDAAHAISV